MRVRLLCFVVDVDCRHERSKEVSDNDLTTDVDVSAFDLSALFHSNGIL